MAHQQELKRILNQAERSFAGDAWHGSSLKDIVQDISAEQAMMRPIASAHTIWELILHITAWEGEVVRRLQTGDAHLPEEGDWQEIPAMSAAERDAAWEKALQRLFSVHHALEEEIMRHSDEQLDEMPAVPRVREVGSGVSLYVLLHGVVQHGIYHAGQIALLKKALQD